MSLIRSLGRLRQALTLLSQHGKQAPHSQTANVRNAGTLIYRGQVSKEPPLFHYAGEAMSFFLWYWILYHCYFEYEHLVPSHEFPNPTKFTDAELGIPPDDED